MTNAGEDQFEKKFREVFQGSFMKARNMTKQQNELHQGSQEMAHYQRKGK